MTNILHITPHLGGGIGTVLLNWLSYDKSNSHTVVTLDYANEFGINICRENRIELFSQIPVKDILSKIQNADITVIHFWNHPLLYDFLIRNPLPKSRTIFWFHVSGAKPPYVFNKKLFDICDRFVFTTPISYYYVQNNPKLACILSTGGAEKFNNIKHKKHNGYTISYIGTVDYVKMHPDYVKTITKTNADKIIVAGGDNEKEIFKNADRRFDILGKINDITPVLEQTDVFAYLLNPNHYGTAEQVLQEVMTSGIVPVVLNNPCEASLVKHFETGLIANNLDEYVEYINRLKNDVELRTKLSENAKEYAKNEFSLKHLTNEWQNLFDEVLKSDKTEKIWKTSNPNLTSYDIFLESLGEYSAIFKNKTKEELKQILKQPEWSSKTKATPYQYYDFLGGDELKKLLSL